MFLLTEKLSEAKISSKEEQNRKKERVIKREIIAGKFTKDDREITTEACVQAA